MPKFKHVLGTLEHCYEALEGDLNNSTCAGYRPTTGYILWHKNRYVLSPLPPFGVKPICTIEQFNEYAKQMKQKENKMSKEQPPFDILRDVQDYLYNKGVSVVGIASDHFKVASNVTKQTYKVKSLEQLSELVDALETLEGFEKVLILNLSF